MLQGVITPRRFKLTQAERKRERTYDYGRLCKRWRNNRQSNEIILQPQQPQQHVRSRAWNKTASPPPPQEMNRWSCWNCKNHCRKSKNEIIIMHLEDWSVNTASATPNGIRERLDIIVADAKTAPDKDRPLFCTGQMGHLNTSKENLNYNDGWAESQVWKDLTCI